MCKEITLFGIGRDEYIDQQLRDYYPESVNDRQIRETQEITDARLKKFRHFSNLTGYLAYITKERNESQNLSAGERLRRAEAGNQKKPKNH